MSLLNKIQPLRRAQVIETGNVIRKTLKFHGKAFTMADFGGSNWHVKMLRETGLFSIARLNKHKGSRPMQFTFNCDKEAAQQGIEDYLENTFAARVYEAQIKVQLTRDARKQGLAPETPDETTEPVIERIGNCTVYYWSRAKHWQKQEGKRGYIPTCTTLGGNTVEHYG